MYNRFQLAKKYLHYYLTASNGKGHGVHSPFVFDFIKNVLNDNKKYDCYRSIEKIRTELLHDKKVIEVEDFGAGSAALPLKSRAVKDIAATSLKPRKFGQLFFRMVKYYQPHTIVELGTSLGITTSYLAATGSAEIFTLEGSKNIAAIAESNLKKLVTGAKVIVGNFDGTLPRLLPALKQVDLAFIDGNHRQVPTLDYFHQLIQKSTGQTILIFDDIHWSAEMENAWNDIREDPAVTLSIDLFFIGIVFFKKDFRVKQHFVIRF